MTNASRVINSAFFSVAAKLLGKSLGLISTIIIARILAPEDFGLIAIVGMALYFFDILSHAAGDQYIVQKSRVSFYDLHTAWSLNLLLKVLIACAFVSCAHLIAAFFEQPELSCAFVFSAVILPLQAFKSPKLLLLKRQLRFKPLFWISFIERLFALPVLVSLAVILGNYWAFLITDVFVAALGLVLSFVIAPAKLHFTFKKIRQQWGFSQWMMGKHLLGYARSQIDTLVVAKSYNTMLLGNYHMARDLAMMPAHYLLSPAIEPLLAVLKNDRYDKPALLNNVAFSLLVVVSISAPILAILTLFSQPLVYILLGDKWQVAAQLLPVLGILFFYWCVVQVLDAALIALNKVRFLFVFDLFSMAAIALSLAWAVFYDMDIVQLAWARALSGLASALVLVVCVFFGFFSQLKPLVSLSSIILVITLIQLFLINVFGFANFSFSESTNESLVYSIIGIFTLLFMYGSMFLLLLVKCPHYHLVRIRSLIQANGMFKLN